MINESTLYRLFDFIVYQLPNLATDFVNYFFTPLKSLFGKDLYNVLKLLFTGLLPQPFNSLVWDTIYEPIFNFGLVGLFSVSTLGIILILKVIDLVVPV